MNHRTYTVMYDEGNKKYFVLPDNQIKKIKLSGVVSASRAFSKQKDAVTLMRDLQSMTHWQVL